MCRTAAIHTRTFALFLLKVLSEDIFLLKQIRVTLDATKISIVDARSRLNAKANQVGDGRSVFLRKIICIYYC